MVYNLCRRAEARLQLQVPRTSRRKGSNLSPACDIGDSFAGACHVPLEGKRQAGCPSPHPAHRCFTRHPKAGPHSSVCALRTNCSRAPARLPALPGRQAGNPGQCRAAGQEENAVELKLEVAEGSGWGRGRRAGPSRGWQGEGRSPQAPSSHLRAGAVGAGVVASVAPCTGAGRWGRQVTGAPALADTITTRGSSIKPKERGSRTNSTSASW